MGIVNKKDDWNTKKKQKWVLMGKVGVDSGMLMVGDPCYFVDNWHNKDYDNLAQMDLFKEVIGDAVPKGNSPNYKKAVAFSSGLGDGVYEVWGLVADLKDWGERVIEVRIKLM